MAKKRFSMFDDPSFSYIAKDKKRLEESRKNLERILSSVEPSICDNCLNRIVGGGCDIHSYQEQSFFMGEKRCPDKLE